MRNGEEPVPPTLPARLDAPGSEPNSARALTLPYHFALKPSISGRMSVPGFRYQ